MMKTSDLLTTAQAAAELGISDSRVRQLILAGRLKFIRVGQRGLLIERAALRAVRNRKPGRPWPKKS